jgi:hypothetical protein
MKKAAIAGAVALAGLVLAPVMLLSMLGGPPKVPSLALGGESSNCTVAAPKISDGLTAESVAAIAYRAGWRGDDIDIAVAVARAESGWRATITNGNTNGSVDYGLFQINSIHAAILAGGNWADPQDNAAMAFKVWTDAGGKWGPWVTFWSGSYRKYLGSTTVHQVCTQPVVTTCSAKVASGYQNGLIPKSALCTLWADRRHRLRSDAAGRFDALAKAYQQQFGQKPCITDSYRSLAAQIDVFRRKPGLAAIPGTSNHGRGLALDLCGPGSSQWVVGSNYDVWMHQSAPQFGWIHPSWAEPSGSRPEPWHWECNVCGAK